MRNLCSSMIFLISLILLDTGCRNQTKTAELNKFKTAEEIQNRNKELARQVFDAIDKNDFDKLNVLLSDDFILSAPGSPQPWKKVDLINGIKTFYVPFPDWTHTINDIVAEGDKVVVKLTGQGTQKGIYENISPTNEKLTQSAVHIITFANGKVKEWWAVEDNLGFMMQLGMELKPIDTKK
jgi:ketosteroid isomerase-like protein